MLNMPHIPLPIGKETDGIGEGEKVQNIRQRWDLRRSLPRGTKDICTECRLDRGMANQVVGRSSQKTAASKQATMLQLNINLRLPPDHRNQTTTIRACRTNGHECLDPPPSSAAFPPLIVCRLSHSSLYHHSINPA